MLSRYELDNKPLLQLLLILSLGATMLLISAVISLVVVAVSFDMDAHNLTNLLADLSHASSQVIEASKLMQLIMATFIFVLTPIIYALILYPKPFLALGFKTVKKPLLFLAVALFMIVCSPVLSWIVELNSMLVLPDFLSDFDVWLLQTQETSLATQHAFLTFDGIPSLLYVLLIVAVIPALGEELLFRGVLQKIFAKWTNNPHLGIWLTALLFSAIHVQVYNFIAITLMGAFFGYLYHWSKSLWLPILGHFVNNGSLVLISYYAPEILVEGDISIFDESDYSLFIYLGSLVACIGIIYFIKRSTTQKNNKIQPTQEVL